MLKRQLELQKQVAERITAILEQKGQSQQEFADALGKNKSHVSRIMNAKMNLTMRLIAEMEKVLGERVIEVNPYRLK